MLKIARLAQQYGYDLDPEFFRSIQDIIADLQHDQQERFLTEIQVLKEKEEHQKERQRQAEARYREKHREEYNAKQAEVMRRRYWAKKKQETESSSEGEIKDNVS